MKFLLAFIGLFTASIGLAQGIQFTDASFADLKEQARENNKLIFIDAYTTWCGPCKMMAKHIFPDSAVGAFFNKNFINAKINMEKGEGPALSKKFMVGCFPSYLVIDSAGAVVHRSAGMMEKSAFIGFGETALAGESTFSAIEKQYRAGNRDPEFVTRYMEAQDGACLPTNDLAVGYLTQIHEKELLREANWKIFQRHVSDVHAQPFTFFLNNRTEFAKQYGEKAVDDKIFNAYLAQLNAMIYGSEKPDQKTFETFRNEMGTLPFSRAGELQANYDLAVAEARSKWTDYFAACQTLIGKHGYDSDYNWLNNVSYTIYEHSRNKQELSEALKWAKKSVDLKAESANLDTYACLLWKNGQKPKAVEIQKKAIAVGKSEGEDTTELEKTLKKIQSSKG